jgi:hypothetical protein
MISQRCYRAINQNNKLQLSTPCVTEDPTACVAFIFLHVEVPYDTQQMWLVRVVANINPALFRSQTL